MTNKILGLHHITAIAGNAQQNYNFYTKVLGLRMVKKTVNFDDPGTYHLYYGDEVGSPGSILTFFPYERVKQGKPGVGMATEIGYAIPPGTLNFWKKRFEEFNVSHGEITEKFEESYLPFKDSDGLNLELIVPKTPDPREPWKSKEVTGEVAIRGFYNVTLSHKDCAPTAAVLTDIFGYKFAGQEGDLYRFKNECAETAGIVDLREAPRMDKGINAGGTNHHVAFRVEDEKSLMHFRELILKKGLHVTEKIDRNYFYSIYFREPGGVLFEIATENPGFAIDESVDDLGSSLQLPEQYENDRERIEKGLPAL